MAPELRFVLASAQESGCYSSMPWMPNRRDQPFPITVECWTSHIAHQLQGILGELAQRWDRNQHLEDFLPIVRINEDLEEICYTMDQTSGHFIVVLMGQTRGIYISRFVTVSLSSKITHGDKICSSLARSSIENARSYAFHDVSVHSTFFDALIGFFTSGYHRYNRMYRGGFVPWDLAPGHSTIHVCSPAERARMRRALKHDADKASSKRLKDKDNEFGFDDDWTMFFTQGDMEVSDESGSQGAKTSSTALGDAKDAVQVTQEL
ncbi:hypothetical protein C8J56DRAFT_1054280 [Mycena floridula]|nr:hypothetical protein C8J56DRAFT_1054255 [Mycena floridula]KAJ7583753.1 hypothetical protein C8J56DRAFT_1054280 [Mycena floridula]